MKSYALAVALILASFSVACGKDESTTSPTTTTPTSPTTSSFASRLTVGGSASRTFTATQSGTVTVTLVSAGSPSTLVGLGLGIPSGGVSACTLSVSLTTPAGPAAQIAATVDAGSYCVAVYDTGRLSAPIDFEITIVYP